MAKIKITCDSTCDLTAELYEKYDIERLPLGISLGEDLYFDNVNVFPNDLFEYAKKTGMLPKTSAIAPAEYMDVFKKYTDEGYDVIHINISSEFSSCFNNANLAAEELGHVYPIDSRNLSSGSGHLALMARELANQGLGVEEIVAKLEEAKERLDVSFIIQTLEYLKMGGRCSSVAALGANLLKLRPEIKVREGKMGVGRKFRGSMEKTVAEYIRANLEGRDDLDLGRIFVTHSPMDRKVVDDAIALVKELQPFKEVIETEAGCTISSHCGPDCIGVLFFTKNAK